MKRAAGTSVILLVVAAGWVVFRRLGDLVQFPWSDDWSEALLKLAFWVAPCAIALRMWGAGGYRAVAAELGLTGSIVRGYGFAAVASMPMLMVLPFSAPLQKPSVSALIGAVLVGPFAEEVLFRGWLFRQLSRRAGWPAAAAVLVSAVVFGLAHLPNLNRYSLTPAALAWVSSAAAVGALFAWLVWRWNSLWPAIGLHAGMNLSWQLIGRPPLAASHAANDGPSLATFGRLGTIVVAILLTWALKRGGAQSQLT